MKARPSSISPPRNRSLTGDSSLSFANAFERYDIGEQSYTIAGRTISISAPRDPAVLLDELIANGSEVDVTDERLPYWAEIWSSSIALSEHLLEAGEVEPSTRCLELGCGLGLVGVSLGFRTPHVRFTDYQPDAVAMARHNWRGAHGGEAEGAVLDWREPPADGRRYDLVVAADVAYEERFFAPLADTFSRCLAPGGHVILAEPSRPVAGSFYLMLRARGWLHQDTRRTVASNRGPVTVRISTFRQGSSAAIAS